MGISRKGGKFRKGAKDMFYAVVVCVARFSAWRTNNIFLGNVNLPSPNIYGV